MSGCAGGNTLGKTCDAAPWGGVSWGRAVFFFLALPETTAYSAGGGSESGTRDSDNQQKGIK